MSRRLSFVFAAILTLALGACTNPMAPDASVPQASNTIAVQGSGT